MKTITPQQLLQYKENGIAHQLIDIRELYEVETCTIGGENIAMADIIGNVEKIRRDVPVIIHCKSGRRSSAVIHSLEQKFGLQNLYSLEGGILKWIDDIDPTMVKY